MDRKKLIWIGLAIGSTIGSLVPFLWDPTAVFQSIVFGAIGGIAGIWAAFRISS